MTTYSIGWHEHCGKGEETARKFLSNLPALSEIDVSRLPVLAVEGDRFPEMQVFCITCYENPHLKKPYDSSDFMLECEV